MMLNIRSIFFIAIGLAVLSIVVFGSRSYGIQLEDHVEILAAIIVPSAVGLLLLKLKSRITYSLFMKNKKVESGNELSRLLGLDSITLRNNYVLASGQGKLVGHAYFQITNIPYLLDDLDKEKKVFITGNFVRLLSTLSFPFELIPRIMPVPASVYLSQINREISDLRLTLSSEGSVANPKRQARLKYLEKISHRLLEGEGVRDVSWLCHLMVEGKNEASIVRELEANAKTLMSALESGLNVRAERLKENRMLEVLREFFRASLRINPRKANRILAWDLAYLIPLAKPKLPPLEKLLSGIYLGRTTANGIVCLDLSRYANPHMVVVGKSGYGKSTTVKTLTSRMYDLWGTPTIFIDYAGEYEPYVKSRGGLVLNMQTSGINPFELGPVTLIDRMRQLIDTFQKLSELTLVQRNALSYYIAKAYHAKGFMPNDPTTWKNEPPIIQDMIELMREDIPTQRIGKQLTLMALTEKLQALSSGPLGVFRKSKFSVTDLTKGFVCVDLSKVTSTIIKDMVAYTILQHIDAEMRLRGVVSGIRLVIVLDEAWKLCRDEDSLPVTIIKEGRKYGYSLIASSQGSTVDLAESILSNAGTVIIHHTEHPKDLHFIQQAYGLTEQELARIKNAPIGEALAKIGDDPRPFFVKVEMEEVEDGTQTSEKSIVSPLLAQRGGNVNDYEEIGNNCDPLDNPANFRTGTAYDNLSQNAGKLLASITDQAERKTTEYYELLRLNVYQGNKARLELLMHKLIEAVELPNVESMGRYGKVLRLTKLGHTFSNTERDSNRFGGTMHRHIVKMVMRKFKDHKLEEEKPLGEGKRVDLVVDGRIAVEVETRDFSESNIRKNLDAGFEKVIVVCQSRQQATSFQSKLNEIFPNEPRIIITTVASLMSSFEIVGRKKE